mgnify:CR=1 FL=1
MGLEIVEADRQEQLAAALFRRIGSERRGQGPFYQSKVLVPSTGIARYLELSYAQQMGMCAGVNFQLLRPFVQAELQRGCLLDAAQELSPARLQWRLFERLRGRDFSSWGLRSQVLQRFLEPSHPRFQLRAWQLAGQLAHVYDHYAMHRPECLCDWLQGTDRPILGSLQHADWQIQLFRALADDLRRSKLEIESQLLGLALYRYQQADAFGAQLNGLETPIHLYGLSALAPQFLAFFKKIAQGRQVFAYHLLASQAYLGDLPKKMRLNDHCEPQEPASDGSNALLIQSGQQAARLQSLLLALEFPIGETPSVPEKDGDSLSLLQQVQVSIRNNEAMSAFQADGSLSFHTCPSPLRELEVLQQQVLVFLQADPTLQLEDILVLMPKVEDYRALIELVFARSLAVGQQPAVRLPYSIVAPTPLDASVPGRFLVALMQFVRGRQNFSDFQVVLDFEPVRRHLGLTDSEVEALGTCLQAAGVRWGLDAATRQQQGQPDTDAFTWDAGLNALMDLLMNGSNYISSQSMLGAGSRMPELIGICAQAVRSLATLIRLRHQEQPFAIWAEGLRSVLQDLLGKSEEAQEWIRPVLNAVQTACDQSSSQPIAAELFFEILLKQSGVLIGAGPFFRRGIHFATLEAARHIPARVICLLGMNEGQFPRGQKALDFDLTQTQRQLAAQLEGRDRLQEIHFLGDRSQRDEDRQLFLDCLMSARDRLYISSVGQVAGPHSVQAPSIVVTELQQFLQAALPSDVTALHVQHALQAWGALNFQQPQPGATDPLVPIHFDPALAVDPEMAQAAVPFSQPPMQRSQSTALAPASGVHSLQAILRFFRDPAADYLHKQYAIDFKDVEWLALSQDEEPLQALNGLDLWSLRQRVYTDYLAQSKASVFDRERYRKHLTVQGALPVGQLGAQVWQQTLSPLIDFLQQFLGRRSWQQRRTSWQRTHLELHTSSLQDAAGKQLVVLNAALRQQKRWEAKAALELFARHTIFGGVSIVLCLKSCKAYQLDVPLPQSEVWLQHLLQAYQDGQHSPFSFSYKIAEAWWQLRTESPATDAQAHLRIAYERCWEDTAFGGASGDQSAAQRLCFAGDSPAKLGSASAELFMHNAQQLLGPFPEWLKYLKCLEGGEHV